MNPHWSRSSVGFGALLVTVGLAACSAVFGFETLQDGTADSASPQPPPAPVPAVDAGPEAGCIVGHPVGSAPAYFAQTPTLTHFALNGLRFLPMDALGAAPGLDLDCNDTRSPTDETARCALPAGYNPVDFVDFEGGVDNMTAKFLALASKQAIIRSIDERVKAGEVGVTFTVRADLVGGGAGASVGAFPARGFELDGGISCNHREAGAPVPAGGPGRTLSAGDVWCSDPQFKDPGAPPGFGLTALRSSEAWVDGAVLVAFFPRLSIPLLDVEAADGATPSDPVLYLTVTNAWLKARIEGPDGSRRLSDGVIGGRWQILDALNFLSAAAETDCDPTDDIYRYASGQLCGLRDVIDQAESSGPAPCDAMSIGMSFEAYEVDNVGTFGPVASKRGNCAQDVPLCVDAGDGGP